MSSCITFLSLLRGMTFNFFHTDNGMALEDAPESTKQLWRFMLNTSNVKRKGGTKGFPFLSLEKYFTVGLLIRYVRAIFSPYFVLFIGVSTDFKACNKNSFYWGILHMSLTDILAFNVFKSSTML
jgi:hypothetical protein